MKRNMILGFCLKLFCDYENKVKKENFDIHHNYSAKQVEQTTVNI